MNKCVLVLMGLCLVLSAAGFAGEKNGNGFPEFSQKIEVEFANAEDAQKAELQIAPLPFGKKVAWTHRSDDSDWRHVATAEHLHKYGFKTTCYLNGIDDKYRDGAIKKLKELGCGFGNHTLNHPNLAVLTPNRMFFEIAVHQATVEAATDMVSVGFTSPFCVTGAKQSANVQLFLGEVLRRAGIFSTAEGNDNDYAKHYGLKENEMFGNYYMPTMWKYDVASMDKDFPGAFDKAGKDPKQPRMAFGMHSWQSPQQYATLDIAMDKYKNKPEIWYATENEYAAYRYGVTHAAPVKAAATGKNAVWTLTRVRSADIGAAIPLEIAFGVSPAAVKVDGKEIKANADGRYEIPGIGNIPAAIEKIDSGAGTSKKVPALSVSLAYEKKQDSLLFLVENQSGKDIENIFLTLKVPPEWVGGVWTHQVKTLKAGERKEFAQKLGEKDARAEAVGGDRYFIAKLDFDQDGKTYRLYTITEEKAERVMTSCPRDCSMWLGPVLDDAVSPENLAKYSTPGTVLPNVGEKLNEVWVNTSSANDAPFKMELNYRDNRINRMKSQDAKAIWDRGSKLKCVRFIAVDIDVAEAGDYYLIGSRNGVRELWLNGKKTDYDRSNRWKEIDKKFPLNKGLNRLIIVHNMADNRWQAEQDSYAFTVWKDDKRSTDGVKFAKPETAK